MGIPMLKMRPSYLLHRDPYTGKTTSLYWDGLLDVNIVLDGGQIGAKPLSQQMMIYCHLDQQEPIPEKSLYWENK